MRKENSTNARNERNINGACGTAHALSIIGGRWKPTILHHLLLAEKLRFGELRDQIEGISERMLVLQLRELEADGIITRMVYAEVPPRVEYALTDMGLSMREMLESISRWGVMHKAIVEGQTIPETCSLEDAAAYPA
jgi:DNA-binding HxlR family transcriptional regulator